jgi:transcriptional regulator NrdR family protein
MSHSLANDGNALRCRFCGSAQLKVIDSRPHKHSTRRRRECETCKQRFYTFEVWSDRGGKPIAGQDKAMWLGLST